MTKYLWPIVFFLLSPLLFAEEIPPKGIIHYKASIFGLSSGDASLRWDFRDGKYSAELELNPKILGVKTKKRVQKSFGIYHGRTIQPIQFWDHQEGSSLKKVYFNYKEKKLIFSDNLNTELLEKNTQDVLSVFFYLAKQFPRFVKESALVSKSNVSKFIFSYGKEETVSALGKKLTAKKVLVKKMTQRGEKNKSMHLWLFHKNHVSSGLEGLPVKIMIDLGNISITLTAESFSGKVDAH